MVHLLLNIVSQGVHTVCCGFVKHLAGAGFMAFGGLEISRMTIKGCNLFQVVGEECERWCIDEEMKQSHCGSSRYAVEIPFPFFSHYVRISSSW